MGNLGQNIKKFVSNKNTVTILGVFACIIVLYIGYNYRVNQKVKFVTVLYAKERIEGNTQLTEEMIGMMKVNSDLVKKNPNIAQNYQQIQDEAGKFKYVDFNNTISANSLIYLDSLINEDDKPDSKLSKVPEGMRYQYFEVDLASTLGNAISPGASIDIYAYISGTERMFGKLYSNVNVVDVVDSGWTTTSGNKEKNPDLLIVLVKEEDYRLLEKTKKISNIELIPAPNNYSYEEQKDKGTVRTSAELEVYIENMYSQVTDDFQ